MRWNIGRIAREVGLNRSTVSRILRRNGMNLLRSMGTPLVVRYGHARPGDLIRFDIKRLARLDKPVHRVTECSAKSRAARATSTRISPSTTTRASVLRLFCPTKRIG